MPAVLSKLKKAFCRNEVKAIKRRVDAMERIVLRLLEVEVVEHGASDGYAVRTGPERTGVYVKPPWVGGG